MIEKLSLLSGFAAVLVGSASPGVQQTSGTPVVQDRPGPGKLTFETGEFRYTLAEWTHKFFGPEWTFEESCAAVQELGVDLDLVAYGDSAGLAKAGVRCLCVLPDMGLKPDGETPYDPFEIGFNDKRHWPRVKSAIDTAIDKAAEGGMQYVIVFTGMATEDAPEAVQKQDLIAGFKTVIDHARERGVVLVLEMLNDKVATPMKGHPGVLGPSTDFCADVVRAVDPSQKNMKLVFDFYHMQAMGEDLVGMIRKYSGLIGYIHVAGFGTPQRGELHAAGNEIAYPRVMAELAKVFGGPVLLEYVPTSADDAEAVDNLKKAIALCESWREP